MERYYNYAIISGNNIKLFNDSEHNFSCLSDTALCDVNITLHSGILKIKAKRIVFDLYEGNYRNFEETWEHKPHRKEIHEGKRYPWSKKKERFVYRGWVRTEEREPIEMILSHFKIEIYE